MTQSKKKVNWSELCPEMVRCVFERLSFTCLKRGRSVCSSWRTALRGCVPKRNQIPWLILFPRKNNNNSSSSCVLFVPEDRDNAYRTRDLGADFVKSSCVATYGSWLLMLDTRWNLTILNPLTGERIDLPTTDYARYQRYQRLDDIKPRDLVACFWIDDRSKDYLVVCKMDNLIFTKKGNHLWRPISGKGIYKQMVYEHTSQKLYIRSYYNILVQVWSLSGDEPQQVTEDEYPPVDQYTFWDFLSKDDQELYLNEEEFCEQEYVDSRVYIAVSTVSGQVLKVANMLHKSKKWSFLVYKMNPIELTWEVVDSLGDEALILDMGITVVAKDVPGIKRNSIYFSGLDNGNSNPDRIFVFDLTTHEIEPLPQCVLSSIRFSDARWFFPGLDV